jgi:hypothetical protein
MRIRELALAAVILVATAAPATALEIADRDAARAVIDRQIAAFKREDAAEAYSQASPTIKRMFPTQERFMELVREGYRPVYQHRRYSFGEARDGIDGGVEQPVDIQDEAGRRLGRGLLA